MPYILSSLRDLIGQVLQLPDEGDVPRRRVAPLLAIAYELLEELQPAAGADDLLARFAAPGNPMAPATAPARPPRDLRRQMAGPLPPVVPPPPRAPFAEVPAPDPDNPEVYQGNPDDPCPAGCGGPVEAHPIDENMPAVDGMYPHVMCDQSRCYSWTSRRPPPPRAPAESNGRRPRPRRPRPREEA